MIAENVTQYTMKEMEFNRSNGIYKYVVVTR
jgi:hypothetical protein